MYATFQNQQFAHFTAGSPSGAPTKRSDAFHAVPLTDDQHLRLQAIYRSGFEALASLPPKGELAITPSSTRRAVQVRILYGTGSGGTLIKDMHRLSLAAAGRRIADDMVEEIGKEEAQAKALEAIRGLLEAHPAPSRLHLLETFAGLWPLAHTDFRPALKEGLLNALTALKVPGAEAEVALAVQTAQKSGRKLPVVEVAAGPAKKGGRKKVAATV